MVELLYTVGALGFKYTYLRAFSGLTFFRAVVRYIICLKHLLDGTRT